MKKTFLRYFGIFLVGVFLSFWGIILFNNYIQQCQQRNLKETDLAFLDLRSEEMIPFSFFDKEDWDLVRNLCIRNENGEILFWGEYDGIRGILTGNIFMPEDGEYMAGEEYYPIAIVNTKDGNIYYLYENLSTIINEDYYITFNVRTVQTEREKEHRYELSVFYCSR